MKNTRKFLAIFMVIAMIMSMGVLGIFADENSEHIITITNTKPGHKYEAYQVFKGDFENKTLVDIEWGDGVDAEGVLTALVNDYKNYADSDEATVSVFGKAFEGVTVPTAPEPPQTEQNKAEFEQYYKDLTDMATKVADAISADTFTASQVDAFAEIIGAKLTTTIAGYSTENTDNDGKTIDYTIDLTGDGYYFVKDGEDSLEEGAEGDAFTKYILQVCDDVEVKVKGDAPELEKKIVDDNGTVDDYSDDKKVDANTKNIGDTVNYKLTSEVPKMTGYNKYFFIVHDTMSEGLTFDPDSVKVTIGGEELTVNTDYEVVEAGNDTVDEDCTFEIIFKDFIQYKDNPDTTQTEGKEGQEIVITYSAILNQDAEIGVNGNTNTANLEYSNNPNVDYEGDPDNPDKPNPTEPTGETPEDTVITYSTEIKLIKVDKNDETKILTGAKFSISGDVTKVKVINSKMYVPYETEPVEGETNVWYRLKDGTYTQEAPGYVDDPDTKEIDEKNIGKYDVDEEDGIAPKYKYVEVLNTDNVKESFTAEGWVIADETSLDYGTITFTGLGEGTYTITEIVAPEGYNLLKAPITVVITSNVSTIEDPDANTTVTWTAKNGTGENADNWKVTTDDDVEDGTYDKAGIIVLEVENTSGSTLPGTGSIGTTIFYVAGGIMVVAAVIFLVTKKRMNKAEN